MRCRWILVFVVAACGKSSKTTGAQVSKDAAPVAIVAPRFPACAAPATITPIKPSPFEVAVAKRAGDSLVVTNRVSTRRYASYDLARRSWFELPDIELEDMDDVAPFTTTTKSQLLVTYEKKGAFGAFALDLAKKSWTKVVPFESPYSTNFLFTVGDSIVVLPYRPCGFEQFALAHRLDKTKFVPVPGTLAPRARPFKEVLGNKLVIWGGDVYPDPPATGDIGCDKDDKYKPSADGAVFDPATSQWTPMPAGPPAASRHLAAADPYLYVLSDVVWQYDVTANTWKQLGKLPGALKLKDTLSTAHGQRLVLLDHGGREVLIDASGKFEERKAPWIHSSTELAIDDHRLLFLTSEEDAAVTAYVHDVDANTWCELAWSNKPSTYQVAERVGDHLVLWDYDSHGYEVTIP